MSSEGGRILSDPVGVVCALQSEERLLRGLDPKRILVRRAGIGPERARRAAEELADLGVASLVSFGFAGGLDPKLRPGDVLRPSRIDEEHGGSVSQACPEDPTGVHLSTSSVVGSVADKARLFAGGYSSVDMESFAVAAVAERRGCEFRMLRVVCDDALTVLPRTAIAAVHEDGRMDPGGLLGSLLRRPTDLPRLLRLARGSRAAERRLRTLGESL